MPPTATVGFSMETLPGTQTRRGNYSALSDAAADGDPLLPSGRQGLYVTDRPARDRPWLYAYAACLVATFVGGIIAFASRNKHYAELTSLDTLTNPNSCPLSYPGRRRSLLDDGEVDAATMFEIEQFFHYAASWLTVSMAGSVVLGLGFVALLRVRPALFVYTALGFQMCLLLVGGTGYLASGSDGVAPGVVFFLFAGVLALFILICKSKIVLVSKLLGIAGQGLFANWGLIVMAIGMQFVGALLLIPLALTSMAASRNGGIAYNPARDTNMAECTDATGYGVACCVWQPEPWVPVFHAFASIMATWTVMMMYEIRLFTVAGAISRWYFTPVSALDQHNAVDKSGRFVLSPTRRAIAGSNTLTALSHATGPGLGTCCCGGFILTLVAVLRKLARNSQNGNSNGGLVAAIAACLLQCLAAVLEYLTKFVTVRAAITGEAFFAAGRSVVDLLRRNAMDAYSVWWMPHFVLQACALISAAAWALLLSLTSLPFWESKYTAEVGHTADVTLGIISFFLAWIVLANFCSLLLNVVDTVFVCVAMDRDASEVTRADIVEVVSQLPSVKQVAVEQPGGEVVIGQADRREQAQSLLPQQGRATAV